MVTEKKAKAEKLKPHFKMDSHWMDRITSAVARAHGCTLSTELREALEEGLNEAFGDERWVSWHVSDVKSVFPHLTDRQCHNILDRVVRKHDATIGISWDVIAEYEDAAGDP